MNHILRQSERLARWVFAMATYHTQRDYVERGRRLYPLLFSDVVRRAMHQARVSCAFDVGAHYGEFARGLRLAGYDGPIVSFEPNADAARVLRAHADRDGAWRVHEFALGRTTTNGTLHRPNASQFASLRPTLPYGAERWGDQVALRDAVPVQIRRLDDVFNSVLPTGIDPAAPGKLLVKIDTQGSDIDVLRGAERILGFVSVLVIELSLIPLYEGAPRYIDALRYVEDAGFSLAAVVPVGHDAGSGVPIELDGCFVRRPAAVPKQHVPLPNVNAGAFATSS